MRFIVFVLAIFFVICCRAGDCTTLTFATLSTYSSHPVTYEEWARDLGTAVKSPNLPDAIEVWNRHFLLTPLICIYSNVEGLPAFARRLDVIARAGYLWIGTVPSSWVAQQDGSNCHAAMALFHGDCAYIVHTLNQGPMRERLYVEKLGMREFFLRTYAVFEIVPIVPGIKMSYGVLPHEIFP